MGLSGLEFQALVSRKICDYAVTQELDIFDTVHTVLNEPYLEGKIGQRHRPLLIPSISTSPARQSHLSFRLIARYKYYGSLCGIVGRPLDYGHLQS
jgi:hypothetical protein